MRLAEPVTTITDYILAAQTAFLGFLLFHAGQQLQQKSILLWGLAFTCIAVAATTGGTFHGFAGQISKKSSAILWRITVYSIIFSTVFMLSGSIFADVGPMLRHWILAIIAAHSFFFLLWLGGRTDYRYAVYNYVPAMIVVLALQTSALFQQSERERGLWMTAAILLSFAAAGIQQSGFRTSKHFNHNDIYHIIQMVAMYLFYRGAILQRDVS